MEDDPALTEVLDRPQAPEPPQKPPRPPVEVGRIARGLVGLAVVVGIATVILIFAGSMLRSTLVDLGIPTRPPGGGDKASGSGSTTPPSTAAAGLPDGLTCQQLADNGLGYPQVVAYWMRTGSPARLGDSQPCTDVFDQGEIDAFLAQGEGQSSKATCQDLSDEGVAYDDVVANFVRRDRPKRLDPDGIGFPCAGVYPQAMIDAFLHFDRQPALPRPLGKPS